LRIAWLIFLFVFGLFGSSCCSPGQNSSLKISYLEKHTFHPQFSQNGKNPAILIIPENDLTARKLAMAGYVAMSTKYGERIDGDRSYDKERLDRIKQRILDALDYLKSQPDVDPERIGAIGYSFGGYFSTYLATQPKGIEIRAAVLYYGLFDTPEDISNLKVPVLAFLGDADTRTRIQWSLDMKEIAMKHHKQFELVIYRNADHGFEYESAPGDRAAAVDSWKRTLSFLEEHVKGKQP
jgi:dienelactone hydrolase